jgi:STE24 endopeptidase
MAASGFRVGIAFVVLWSCLASSPSVAFGLLPAPSVQAIQYQNYQDWFWCADEAMGLIVPLVLLFSGLGVRICDQCRRLSGNRWFLTIGLFAAAYCTIYFALNLPLAFWESYATEHRFGLGTDSPGQWAKDQVIGCAINLSAVFLLTWIPYFFLAKSPRRWWLWSTGALIPVFAFMYIVGPVWIAPLTNKFEPPADKSLEAKITALADRAGISNPTILVKDQSRSSKLPNAQVRGIFATKRIVIFDTAIDQTTERELLLIVAHEMKHYVAGDMWKFFAMQLGVVLLGFYVAHRLGGAVISRYQSSWGFKSIASPASLPLLYLAFNLAVLITTPVENAVERNIEHNADRFALDLTHDNGAVESLAIKYMQVALVVPDPGWFSRVFLLNHPALEDRVRFAVNYHPWSNNPPMK